MPAVEAPQQQMPMEATAQGETITQQPVRACQPLNCAIRLRACSRRRNWACGGKTQAFANTNQSAEPQPEMTMRGGFVEEVSIFRFPMLES